MKPFNSQSFQSITLIIRENPGAMAVVCFFLLISSLCEAVGISAIFPLISEILETGATLPDSKLTDFINALSARGPYFLAGFVIISFVLKSFIMNFAMSIIANNVAKFSHRIRVSFVEAMLNARIHFIFSKSLGENLSVLSNDSVTAAAAYISAARVLSGLFQSSLYFAYALWLSSAATLLSVITMGVLVILVKTTMDRTRKAGARTMKYIHEISKNMGEALRAAKEAKATAREAYLASYIFEDSEQLRKAHATNIAVGQTLRNIQDPVTITSALVCILIFKEFVQLEPGYILFILAVYYRLMSSVNVMMADYQKFVGQEASLRNIQRGIEAAQAAKENLKDTGAAPAAGPQDIAFKNVTMRYGEKTVYSGVSFTVPANKLTVFRGESGRGKTTSVDIICGLIEPTSGEIMVGPRNLREINTRLWRQKIGYVDQFPFLFNGSVRDNITLDLQDVSEEKLARCLKLCHLDKFVTGLEGGLNFELNENGTNISGGQRQRIAIARSILRDPAYLILDEPTSALDQESAEIILKTLAELSKDVSVIVISHSAATEKYADTTIDFDSF